MDRHFPAEHQVDEAHRQYNQWVANETLEDFALRFTAKHARRWSIKRIANTALGIVSFLALEAIGGAITLSYGFTNAVWAIVTVSTIIFLSGIPVCYHAARTGVDIDLLTRGAGFGYIGSTVSSLVYASFTFIFFALEAAIMSSALQMLFGWPQFLSHMLSALVVIPLVTHGITRISFFQLITQPVWALLQIVPLTLVVLAHTDTLPAWTGFVGSAQTSSGFDLYLFGAAAAVIFPLIAQNGEQVDYLRFLPRERENTPAWWAALVLSGPGWVLVGMLKLLAGSFLAVLALQYGTDISVADDPTHMYLIVFEYFLGNSQAAIIIAAAFVIISQLKINVTNAYAGSIAWSNFFSRLTNNHPGRIVWVFFNVSIAFLLMEVGLYKAFEEILITFSALVLSWFGAVTADLAINLPLGLRPKKIDFKRGKLFDINPVGFFSMLLASVVGIVSELGVFGPTAKALSPFMAFFLPFITAPLIAWYTGGHYYLVSNPALDDSRIACHDTSADGDARCECKVCLGIYDQEDMLFCPYYGGGICSLCCSLESLCEDVCRPAADVKSQVNQFLSALLPQRIVTKLQSRVGHFLFIFSIISVLIAGLLSISAYTLNINSPELSTAAETVFFQVFFLFLIVAGVLVWLYVLADNTRKKALVELQHQTGLLQQEVRHHHQTSSQLALAKQQADLANIYKTRYLSGVSHELRTPLNTIFGYAQILQGNNDLNEKTRDIAAVISRSSEHLTDVIEGLLEISKIEAKRLEYLHNETLNIHALVNQICKMFELQAHKKRLDFEHAGLKTLPKYIKGDAKRIRQVLINLLSNAIKFTPQGKVRLSVSYRNQVARFVVEDTGIGIADSDAHKIFAPFERIRNSHTETIPGTGLGLALSKLITELMGGDLSFESTPSVGTRMTLTLMLPAVALADSAQEHPVPKLVTGYMGQRKIILVVDDEMDHRRLLMDLLTPLGFTMMEAPDATTARAIADECPLDLFILDIRMPEVDGWQLASELRERHSGTQIMMASGNAMEMQEEQMRSVLYDAYVTKPVQLDQLLEKIASLLDIEWIHLGDATVGTSTSQEAVEFPDDDTMEQLRWHAQTGNFNDIKTLLAGLDARFDAFRQKVNQYCSSFQFSELTHFLDQHK
ncbi:MAG: response regulator [Gammaproteobacteria bacterium]|nr:response regulator [Gammaproteobacteria bacterium]MBQ0774468.1 response regulator [Gammaproteobacteria bacterium]